MKKILLALVLAFTFVAPAAHAQVASSTPAYPGGHRHAYLAGLTDSINNKGAWLLSNYPVIGQISYIADHPELSTQWKAVLHAFGVDVQ